MNGSPNSCATHQVSNARVRNSRYQSICVDGSGPMIVVPHTMLSPSVPHTMLSPSVPQTMLSPSLIVPQTLLSPSAVPQTMLSPSLVPQTMRSPHSLDPQDVPHTMLSPSAPCVFGAPHRTPRRHALAFGSIKPPDISWLPQMMCLLQIGSTGTR